MIEEKDKIKELEKKIKNFRYSEDDKKYNNSGLGMALRVASDLVAGIVVGSALGYFIDKLLDTKPIFLVICFFLGFVAAFLNIYRSINN